MDNAWVPGPTTFMLQRLSVPYDSSVCSRYKRPFLFMGRGMRPLLLASQGDFEPPDEFFQILRQLVQIFRRARDLLRACPGLIGDS